MTSVPKPLKFLKPHVEVLRKALTDMAASDALRPVLSDICSVLSMTYSAEPRDSLRYCLAGSGNVIQWGHEYLRHLAGQLAEEYMLRLDAGTDVQELLDLVDIIVQYHMQHNAEADAVDLLLEVERLHTLPSCGLIDDHNCPRVCLYLLRCADYLGDPADVWEVLTLAYQLYMHQKSFPEALRAALRLGANSGAAMDDSAGRDDGMEDTEAGGPLNLQAVVRSRVLSVLAAAEDVHTRRQLALMLARHRYRLNLEEETTEDGDCAVPEDELEDLQDILGNANLPEQFAKLAQELDCVEPVAPEAVYKSAITGSRGGAGDEPQSAAKNLASTFVNAFANAGSGKDALMSPEDSNWLHMVKANGKLAAAASVGMMHLWNAEELSAPDAFLYDNDKNVQAGGVLALGIMLSSLAPAEDSGFVLLSDYLEPAHPAEVRAAAALALGLAYSGAAREDVAEALYAVVAEADSPTALRLASHAALAVGMVLAGTANDIAAAVLLDRLMGCNAVELHSPLVNLIALGLGLLYLGQGSACDNIMQSLVTLPAVVADGKWEEEDKAAAKADKERAAAAAEAAAKAGEPAPEDDNDPMLRFVDTPAHNITRFTAIMLRACAYAGTGDVLQIQRLLHLCAEHPQAEAEAKAKQAAEAAAAEAGQTGAAMDTPAAAGLGGAAAAGGGGMPQMAGLGGAAAAAAGATAGSSAADGSGETSETPTAAKHRGAYSYQSAAVLGIALMSMGEELSVDMLSRMADHLLQYGDPAVKRAVPLALALAHVSDPDYATVDVLSKLTHDVDEAVAQAAILALGLMGAGTKNSRIMGLLRQLTTFYTTSPQPLFMTRVAQGLLSMGKGLISLTPLHSDRLLMCPSAVASLITVATLGLELGGTVHGAYNYLLYALAPAMMPRMLMTVDEAMRPVAVEVRVGTAVDTVGQPGRPKTITGFQTHTTPVLLGVHDRAELVDSDTWEPVTSVLEGTVILRRKQEA